MKKFSVLIILFVAITAFMGRASAAPAIDVVIAPADTVAVIVQAENVETAVSAVESVNGQVNETLAIINAVSADVSEEAIALLEADERVVLVTLDRAANIAGRAAPSTFFPEAMGADEVWEEGVEGAGVTIAIVDTGIGKFRWNRGRIVARYDALDNGTRKKDPHGHGSMMASIAANSKEDKTEKY